MQSIEVQVRQFIVENFLFGDQTQALAADESLLGSGIIDSTGVLELVGFLESNFQISVADLELIPDNLDSIKRISEFISRKTKR